MRENHYIISQHLQVTLAIRDYNLNATARLEVDLITNLEVTRQPKRKTIYAPSALRITPIGLSRSVAISHPHLRVRDLFKEHSNEWDDHKKGDYNVKSGYHLQRQLPHQQSQQQQPQHPSSEEMKSCCVRLWKTHDLPPKLNTFWWGALQDGLPVARKTYEEKRNASRSKLSNM
ncbi:hypothetical protein Bca101_025035 [Brassica carinata]